MSTKLSLACCIVLILLCHGVVGQPDLPNHFESNVQLSTAGSVMTGYFYFDYTYQAFRFDSDNSSYSEITLFNVDQPARYTADGSNCRRVVIPSGNIFTMQIPSYAQFNGYSNVNGKVCQNWNFEFLGTTHKFAVSNDTDNIDGKLSWRHESITIVNAYYPNGLALVFTEQDASPPDRMMFDVTKFNNCTFPTPGSVPTSSLSFGGFARNAQTNLIIPGAQVSLKGIDVNKVMTATTTQQGFYLLSNVPKSNYTLSVSAPGFYSYDTYITVDGGNSGGNLPGGRGDAALVATLNPGQWRAVITWDFEPRDIDLHVRTPSGCEVNYNRRYCPNGNSLVELDLDTTEGWGPESATFSGATGNHSIYAYIYEGDAPYTVSNARLRLYSGSSTTGNPVVDVPVLTEFYDERNRFWYILDFEPSGNSANSVNVVNAVLPALP